MWLYLLHMRFTLLSKSSGDEKQNSFLFMKYFWELPISFVQITVKRMDKTFSMKSLYVFGNKKKVQELQKLDVIYLKFS